MKTKFLLPIVVFLFFATTGFSQNRKEMTEEALKSWMGSTEHELILQLGSTFSTTTDGAGGKIIKYSTTISNTVGVPIGNTVIYTDAGATVYFYEFYINDKGIVYLYKVNYKMSKKEAKKTKKKQE